MNKRQIAFKGSFSNGAEHTDYLTIHDNYQGTRRAAVVVDKHAMYTPADIDALIAALRSARDALAGDAALGLATPQDDADADWRAWDAEMATPEGQAKLARLAADAAPAPMLQQADEIHARLKQEVEDGLRAEAAYNAYYDAPAAPQRETATMADMVMSFPADNPPFMRSDETRRAAPVRLTRAQLGLLHHLSRFKDGWTKWSFGDYESWVEPALRTLADSGMIQVMSRSDAYTKWTLTDAGRTALAAAQRETDDARDGGEER